MPVGLFGLWGWARCHLPVNDPELRNVISVLADYSTPGKFFSAKLHVRASPVHVDVCVLVCEPRRVQM